MKLKRTMARIALLELLAILIAWLHGEGPIAALLWSWMQVVAGSVTPHERIYPTH